jgi:hypothetical protein
MELHPLLCIYYYYYSSIMTDSSLKILTDNLNASNMSLNEVTSLSNTPSLLNAVLNEVSVCPSMDVFANIYSQKEI